MVLISCWVLWLSFGGKAEFFPEVPQSGRGGAGWGESGPAVESGAGGHSGPEWERSRSRPSTARRRQPPPTRLSTARPRTATHAPARPRTTCRSPLALALHGLVGKGTARTANSHFFLRRGTGGEVVGNSRRSKINKIFFKIDE